MVGYGENGSVVGPQNLPTSSAASGVWSLGEQAEAQRDNIWPNPTLGFWTFVGDLDSTGAPIADYYSEGGLFQTAAMVAAGNNEHMLIARTTGQANQGVTGSLLAIITGLRINGNAPASGTINYNKGLRWQYSNGIAVENLGNMLFEDSSGNLYFAFSGYVGANGYNPPRHFGNLTKLNSSLVFQWAQVYKNNPMINEGTQMPIIGEIYNGALVYIPSVSVAQAFGTSKKVLNLTEVSPGAGNLSGAGARVMGPGFSFAADNVSQGKIFKNYNPMTNNANGFLAFNTYASNNFTPGGGFSFPGNHQQFALVKITFNGSAYSYVGGVDNIWYNRSGTNSQQYDLSMVDFDTIDNTDTTFSLMQGGAQSVVDSSTKTVVGFGAYTWGASESSAFTYILKCQNGGKNENFYASSMCLDLANSCVYLMGSAANIGAANTGLSSIWIGKFPTSNVGIPTGAVSWINSYCNESFPVNAKAGRNSLKLTANNSITAYGYTQSQSGSGTPAMLSIITVPTDGSAKGGTGTVDDVAVSSHDISPYVLWQYVSNSTNVNFAFSTSGTANMQVNSSYNYIQTQSPKGTQYLETLDPNPTEYENGGM